MQTREQHITPALAATMIEKNHPRNRPRIKSRVAFFAAQLLAGKFEKTHQGIAFDKKGLLVDGQHRLAAIIETGIAMTMLVTTGLDDRAIEAMDNPAYRADWQQCVIGGTDIDRTQAALVKLVVGSINGVAKLDKDQLREWFAKLKPGIDFVDQHAPARRVNNVIRAAIVRAWFVRQQERARLIEFCCVLANNDVSSNGDGAAVRLISMITKADWTSMAGRRQLYCVAERAVVHFLQFNCPGNLKPVTEEQFVLPWEQAEDGPSIFRKAE